MSIMTIAGAMLGGSPAISTSESSEPIVRIDGEAGGLAGSKMFLAGRFVGLIGDLFTLMEGTHDLSVDIAQGRSLRLVLAVQDSKVRIKEVAQGDPGCYSGPIWKLGSAPSSTVNVDADGVAVITLGRPNFQRSNVSMGCSPSTAGCSYRNANVTVNSTPDRAEIWMNGVKLVPLTNTVLSVPYCPGGDTVKQFLVRLRGRANCTRDVTIPRGPLELSCELQLPKP